MFNVVRNTDRYILPKNKGVVVTLLTTKAKSGSSKSS